MNLLSRVKNYKEALTGQKNDVFRGRLVCKLTGVTFEGRQKKLAAVGRNTPLKLERERGNEYDFHAVRVLAKIEDVWQDIGYIPRTNNKDIAHALDCGVVLQASVRSRLGNPAEGFNFGLQVDVERPIADDGKPLK